jgi:hypothetical protein
VRLNLKEECHFIEWREECGLNYARLKLKLVVARIQTNASEDTTLSASNLAEPART